MSEQRQTELLESLPGIIVDSFSDTVNTTEESGEYTYQSDEFLRSVAIFNRSEAELTLNVNGIAIPVPAGESFDGVFRPFKTVLVAATGAFDAVVRV